LLTVRQGCLSHGLRHGLDKTALNRLLQHRRHRTLITQRHDDDGMRSQEGRKFRG